MLCFEVLACVFEAGTLTSLPHTQQCDLSGSCTVSAQVMARGDRNIYVPILKSEENPAAFANDACFGLFDPSEHPDEYDDLDLAKVIVCLSIVYLSVDWINGLQHDFLVHPSVISVPTICRFTVRLLHCVPNSLLACFTVFLLHLVPPHCARRRMLSSKFLVYLEEKTASCGGLPYGFTQGMDGSGRRASRRSFALRMRGDLSLG